MNVSASLVAFIVAQLMLRTMALPSTAKLRMRASPDAAEGLFQVSANAEEASLYADWSEEVAVMHAGEDCWNPCGNRGGYCNWCGEGNACCRGDGFDQDPHECKLAPVFAPKHHHQCVHTKAGNSMSLNAAAAPEPAGAQKAVTEKMPAAVQAVLHVGDNCFAPCGNRGGYCSWCGEGNACCRGDGYDENHPAECERAQGFTAMHYHQCVKVDKAMTATEARVEKLLKVELDENAKGAHQEAAEAEAAKKIAAEKAAAEKKVAEKAAADKAASEKAAAEKEASEKAAAEKAAAEKASAEKEAAAKKAAAEKEAAEKAAAEKEAAKKAAAEKASAEKATAEKKASEKAVAEKAAAEKAAAEKEAAEKAAAEKAEKEAAQKAAAEEAAVRKAADEALMHVGENCFAPCGNRGGYCNWCGEGNACCRGDGLDADHPAECERAEHFTAMHYHQCVKVQTAEKEAEEKAAAKKAAAEEEKGQKVAAEKVAAEKIVADKASDEKATANRVPSDKPALQQVATETATVKKEKTMAERIAASKWADQAATLQSRAAEIAAAHRSAIEQAAAQKAAMESAAIGKLAAKKASLEILNAMAAPGSGQNHRAIEKMAAKNAALAVKELEKDAAAQRATVAKAAADKLAAWKKVEQAAVVNGMASQAPVSLESLHTSKSAVEPSKTDAPEVVARQHAKQIIARERRIEDKLASWKKTEEVAGKTVEVQPVADQREQVLSIDEKIAAAEKAAAEANKELANARRQAEEAAAAKKSAEASAKKAEQAKAAAQKVLADEHAASARPAALVEREPAKPIAWRVPTSAEKRDMLKGITEHRSMEEDRTAIDHEAWKAKVETTKTAMGAEIAVAGRAAGETSYARTVAMDKQATVGTRTIGDAARIGLKAHGEAMGSSEQQKSMDGLRTAVRQDAQKPRATQTATEKAHDVVAESATKPGGLLQSRLDAISKSKASDTMPLAKIASNTSADVANTAANKIVEAANTAAIRTGEAANILRIAANLTDASANIALRGLLAKASVGANSSEKDCQGGSSGCAEGDAVSFRKTSLVLLLFWVGISTLMTSLLLFSFFSGKDPRHVFKGKANGEDAESSTSMSASACKPQLHSLSGKDISVEKLFDLPPGKPSFPPPPGMDEQVDLLDSLGGVQMLGKDTSLEKNEPVGHETLPELAPVEHKQARKSQWRCQCRNRQR